jgi:hypothetical protein
MTTHYDRATAGYGDIRPLFERPQDFSSWSMPSYDQALANGTVITAERIYAVKVPCYAGQVISGISWLSSSTTPGAMTHQISAVHDESGVVLRQSTDRTSTAWPVSTWGDFTLTSNYTFVYTGFTYVSIKISGAAAMPSLSCKSCSATLTGNQRGSAPTPDNRVHCGTAQTTAADVTTMPTLTLPLAAVGSLPVVGLIRA